MMQRAALILCLLAVLAGACSAPVALPFLTSPQPTSRPTEAISPSPSATLTPSPSPTDTPQPTPLPAVRLNLGETNLFLGDYEAARREYQEALVAAQDSETRAEAALGVGRALMLQANFPAAILQFKLVIDSFPGSDYQPDAWFFLARCYDLQQNYIDAANAYAKYLSLRPTPLLAYVQSLRGEAALAGGDGVTAIDSFKASIQAQSGQNIDWERIQLAQAYLLNGDQAAAVTELLDVYNTSASDYTRASANFLLGRAYLSMGENEQAFTRFLDSVNNYPASYDTYAGLVELVNSNVAVSELNRGLVDYFAGQYGYAVEAFTRFIDSARPEDSTAYYYRALSHRALNQPEAALADLDLVIKQYVNDRFWQKAYREKAYTLWAYLDRFDEAAQALIGYVDINKESVDAPDMLFEAGRIYERGGNLDGAVETWTRLMDSYPSAEMSYRGLFLSGVTRFRQARYPDARLIFQRALVLGTSPGEQAAAYLWIGKTYKLEGNPSEAVKSWEAAVQRDPTGYYSGRAAELIINREPFALINPLNLGYDLNAERAEAETWLRSTFSLPPETNLSDLGPLKEDPAFQRAVEFNRLGLYAQARDEIEKIRAANSGDAAALFRLLNFLLENNYYRPAILTARQILNLANLNDLSTLRAPVYFNHIRFGVYFRDLMLSASRDYDLNILFLLSLVRQESLFEPFAVSGAGASGLLQIMPPTGQEISKSLNWPPAYTNSDLTRPVISIPFGASYLARQRDYFGGNLYAALAAYNGGPGNTIRWNDLAGGDPDLLLEVIRADETRTYIKQIFEFFNLYRYFYEQRP